MRAALLLALLPSLRPFKRLMLIMLACTPWLGATAGERPLLAAQHPLTQEAAPGAIIHLAFWVDNDLPRQRQFDEQLSTPDGWHLVFPTTDFALPALGHQLRLFSIQISPSAAAQSAHLQYTLTDRDSGYSQSITTQVDVAATQTLSLIWQPEPPRWLFQNHKETVHAQLVNTGNVHQHLQVEVNTPNGVRATISTDALTLAPGEQVTLPIQLTLTPPAPTARLNAVPRIAVLLHSPNTTYRLEHRFEQLVIHSDVNHHVRLPLQLHTTLQRTHNHMELESALSGSGHIDEAQHHHLQFLIRRGNASPLAHAHRLRQILIYQGPDTEATLGDFVSAVSPLTTTGRLGRGIALALGTAEHPIRVGGHSQQVKSGEGLFERAIHLDTQLGPTLRHQLIFAQANSVDEAPVSSGHQRHRWISSVLRSPPLRDHSWQMEVATSRTQRALDTPHYGRAWHAQGAGTLPHTPTINYRFSGWHIDQAFAHPLSGEALYRLDLTGQLHDTLRARVHGYRRHAETRGTRSQRVGVQISRRIQPRWTAEWGHQVRSDRIATTPLQITHEHHIGLRYRGSMGSVSGRVEWRNGQHARSVFSARYRPSPDFILTLRDRRSTDSRDHPLLEAVQHQGRSLAMRWRPINSFSLNLSYSERVRVSDRPSAVFNLPMQQRSHALSARLQYTHSRHQHGWLEAQRHRDARGHWHHSLKAGWTVAFDAPIRHRRDVGSLHGQIVPPPKQAVRVRVAQQGTLSDRDGRFVLHALPSGPQQIELDRSTLPTDRMVEDPDALMVMVPSGGGRHTTIRLIPAATIRGQIALAPAVWSRLDTVPRMLITLHNDDSTHHTLSDHQGQFVFDQLRPGRWVIEVDRSQWPARHHVDVPIQQLVLDGGTHHTIVFNLIPEHRPIQFIDEGRLDD